MGLNPIDFVHIFVALFVVVPAVINRRIGTAIAVIRLAVFRALWQRKEAVWQGCQINIRTNSSSHSVNTLSFNAPFIWF